MNLEPIRALLELAEKLTKATNENRPADLEQHEFYVAARNSVPALSQLLEAVTNLDKLEALLRDTAEEMNADCEKLARQHVLQNADSLKRLLHPEDK